MVRESSYCVIETSDAECVSYAKILLISVPEFATKGEMNDLGGWRRHQEFLSFYCGSLSTCLTRMYTHQQD